MLVPGKPPLVQGKDTVKGGWPQRQCPLRRVPRLTVSGNSSETGLPPDERLVRERRQGSVPGSGSGYDLQRQDQQEGHKEVHRHQRAFADLVRLDEQFLRHQVQQGGGAEGDQGVLHGAR